MVTGGSSSFLFYIILYLLKHVMVLTREEKERFVLDLYNQGKSTREIAEEARISFRDICAILNKAMEDKKTSKEQAEKMSQLTQAYKLFSEAKSPIRLAIKLNIREPEVARLYVEATL
jgi:DNA invertase Pin-like site-specific DNA recombinase